MTAQISPQPLVVGEIIKIPATTTLKEAVKPSYVSISQASQIASSKIELGAVNFKFEHPVIQFTMEDVNIFTREEGLHKEVVLKFSYGKPEVSEVRRIFSSQFDVKGHCNVGQLEYRHLLVGFDLFDNYAQFLGKSTGYLKSKGEEFFFRTFPWTFGFNLKEETPMAVVWISMTGLPPNLFAKRSLLSIASAVGKPIVVDKATQDRTRPSAARVKVIVNLLDKLPKKVMLQFVDSTSGKSVEFQQIIVYDNLPNFCNFCKHQGHLEKACRFKDSTEADNLVNHTNGSGNSFVKLQGDARDFLNTKATIQSKVVNNNQQVNLVWKQKVEPKKSQSAESEILTGDPVLKEGNEIEVHSTLPVDMCIMSKLEGDARDYINANKADRRSDVQVGQSKALASANHTGPVNPISIGHGIQGIVRQKPAILPIPDSNDSVSARCSEGYNVFGNADQNGQIVPAEESGLEQICRDPNMLSVHSGQVLKGTAEPTQNDVYDPLAVAAELHSASDAYINQLDAVAQSMSTADIVSVSTVEIAPIINDVNAQSCKSVNLLAPKVNFHSEVPIVAEISAIVTETIKPNEDARLKDTHATNHCDFPVHIQNAKDGQLKDTEGMQHNNNKGSGNIESANLISNWKSEKQQHAKPRIG